MARVGVTYTHPSAYQRTRHFTGAFVFLSAMSEKREFTGVFVPAHIWVSREISPAEKMILSEIEALSKRNGWCDASRAHFAEWLGIDETNVSKCFTKLEKLGFLQQQQNPGFRTRRRVVNDRFYTDAGVYNSHGGGVKTTRGGCKNNTGGGVNFTPEIQEEIQGKIKEEIYNAADAANAVFSIEIFEPSKKELLTLETENTPPPQIAPAPPAPRRAKDSRTAEQIAQVVEVVEYLNAKAGTKYRANTGDTAKAICGRMADGYTIEEIKRVIDYKCCEWLGTDMQRFLCPATLFRPSNFEKYFNVSNMPAPKPAQAKPVVNDARGIDYSRPQKF